MKHLLLLLALYLTSCDTRIDGKAKIIVYGKSGDKGGPVTYQLGAFSDLIQGPYRETFFLTLPDDNLEIGDQVTLCKKP